jgi:hypothetical protein
MSTKTFHFLATPAVSPGWFGNMQDGGVPPTPTNARFGWTPGNKALTTPYYRGRIGATTKSTVATASSYIDAATGPTKGTSNTNTTAGDSFVTPAPMTGSFAAGVWSFVWNLQETAINSATGRIRMRVWASANADGTAARELTAGTLVGATVTMLSTADVNSSVVWTSDVINLNNEYLFFQVEWQETTLGTTTADDVLFRSTSTVLTPEWVVTTLGITVASPVIDRPVLALRPAGPLDLITASPVLGGPALGQTHQIRPFDKVVASPDIGGPGLARVLYSFGPNDINVGSPLFTAPVMRSNYGFISTSLTVGSPVFGQPLQAAAKYTLTAQGATAGSPGFTIPTLTWNNAFHPLPIEVAKPSLGGPALKQHQESRPFGITTASPVIGAPLFVGFDLNPAVVLYTDRGDPTSMTAIHSNFNANFGLELSAGSNLVGRTDPDVGIAQIIRVEPPLVLAKQKLSFDMVALLKAPPVVLTDDGELTLDVDPPLIIDDDGSLAIEMYPPLVIDDHGRMAIDTTTLLSKINDAVFGVTGVANAAGVQLSGAQRDIAELKARMAAVEKTSASNAAMVAYLQAEVHECWRAMSVMFSALPPAYDSGTNTYTWTAWTNQSPYFTKGSIENVMARAPLATMNFLTAAPAFGVPIIAQGISMPGFTPTSPAIGVPIMTQRLGDPIGFTLSPPAISIPRIATMRPPK